MWSKYITGSIEVDVARRSQDLDVIVTPAGPLITVESIERALEITRAQAKTAENAVEWTDASREQIEEFSTNNAIGSRFCKVFYGGHDQQRTSVVGPCAAIELVEKLGFTNEKTTTFCAEMERVYAPFLDRIVMAQDTGEDEEKALQLAERRLDLAVRQEEFLLRQGRAAEDASISATVRARLMDLDPFPKRQRN